MAPLLAGAPPGLAHRVIVVAVANPRAELPTLAAGTPGLYGASPRYRAGGQALAVLQAVAREHGLQPLAAWPIDLLQLHCVTLLVPEGVSREALLETLQRDPRLALAQPLNSFDALSSPLPHYDDPYLPLQRSLAQWGVLQAHRCTRGERVRVAVVDTGADTGHPDLQGLRFESSNFVDGDATLFRNDRHGTEVLGLMAARPGNARGIVGIAPEAHWLLLKACWQQADGRTVCNSFSLAQALAAAVAGGAQVINLSLAGPADPLLTRLVLAAQARGVVVVAAQAPAGPAQGFPSAIPGVWVVGDDRQAGADLPGAARLAAPAREVLTLTPGGRYDFGNGSSLAAAQVSGLAALLRSLRPQLTPEALVLALQQSATPAAGGGVAQGLAAPRRLDACRALRQVDPRCDCTPGQAHSTL
ncbi:MAG: S8 family peptidase [Rubrivivax sp.]